MTDNSKSPKPPYVSYKSFLNFFDKLSEIGVPAQVDNSIFGNSSGSHIYGMLNAFRFLGLVAEDDAPSQRFIDLVNADDAKRQVVLKSILKSSYPTLFSEIDLANASQNQFDDKLRDMGDIKGSTIDKAATFFLAAAKDTGINVSSFLQKRKNLSNSSASRKSAKQRKETPAPVTDKSPKQQEEIPEKALEYRLVDLMSEAAGDPEVMTAIIKIITFLKTKGQSNED